METTTNSPPTQHVYRGRGNHSVRVPICEADREDLPQVSTVADQIPVRRIIGREVVCVREDLDVGALLDLMVRRRIGCVPVVDERGRPIGMVTKTDVVEQQLDASLNGTPPRSGWSSRSSTAIWTARTPTPASWLSSAKPTRWLAGSRTSRRSTTLPPRSRRPPASPAPPG